jgi:hypothetical protein
LSLHRALHPRYRHHHYHRHPHSRWYPRCHRRHPRRRATACVPARSRWANAASECRHSSAYTQIMSARCASLSTAPFSSHLCRCDASHRIIPYRRQMGASSQGWGPSARTCGCTRLLTVWRFPPRSAQSLTHHSPMVMHRRSTRCSMYFRSESDGGSSTSTLHARKFTKTPYPCTMW